ncbi:uncharacterized protein LOC132258826 [Phlebotomus argentipes]|uniref:uncharacterized protein LOC132258826 n=1 Tax=Phlebotomus argentipes TaxID=94469 RepID=UPI00289319C3|nr:uncharacterized protein LOC132258826 [Phlebotomus argentipes]
MWKVNESNSLNNSILQKSDVKALVQLAVFYIDNQSCPVQKQIVTRKKISAFSNSNLSNNQFVDLFFTVLRIIEEYLRRTARDSGKKDILRKLLQEHKFPEDCMEEVCNTLWKHRDLMLQKYYELKTVNVVPNICWRINISMINDNVARVSDPKIVLEIVYSEGKISTFEISRFMFHRLRYTIAQLLKSMIAIEAKAILKN